jgi:hypothetical protein
MVRVAISSSIGVTLFLMLLFVLPNPYRWLIWIPYGVALPFAIVAMNSKQRAIRSDEEGSHGLERELMAKSIWSKRSVLHLLMIIELSLMKLICLVIVAALAFELASGQTLAFGAVRHLSEDDDIAAAVFRYQLQQRSQQSNWNVFYLALGWDPFSVSDECVKVFSEHAPPVRKFIKSEYDAAQIRKEKGLVLGVSEIKKKSETEAEVEGYLFVVPGEAEGFRFSLIRENGKWLVKSSRATWVA